jgi:hypothetical protein
MAVNAAKQYLPTCDFEATKPCYWRVSQKLLPDDIDALRERVRRAKQAG